MQADDCLALRLRFTADVLAYTTGANLGRRALCIGLARDDALSDASLRVAAQESRVDTGNPQELHARDQRALAVRAAAHVDALSGLTRLEQRAVAVVFTRSFATPFEANLVEGTVGAGRAFDASSVVTKRSVSGAVCVSLTIGRQNAARSLTRPEAKPLAILVRTHRIGRVVGGVFAGAGTADTGIGPTLRIGAARREVERAGSPHTLVGQTISIPGAFTRRNRAVARAHASTAAVARAVAFTRRAAGECGRTFGSTTAAFVRDLGGEFATTVRRVGAVNLNALLSRRQKVETDGLALSTNAGKLASAVVLDRTAITETALLRSVDHAGGLRPGSAGAACGRVHPSAVLGFVRVAAQSQQPEREETSDPSAPARASQRSASHHGVSFSARQTAFVVQGLSSVDTGWLCKPTIVLHSASVSQPMYSHTPSRQTSVGAH